MNRREVENARLRNSADLCKLVEELGYEEGNFFNQCQLNNGAFATSLLNFFDDNPGALEAVQDWILDNSDLDEEDEDEDEDCEADEDDG